MKRSTPDSLTFRPHPAAGSGATSAPAIVPVPGRPACATGCRIGSVRNCSLLCLATARTIDDFWRGTRQFFGDFEPLHGLGLGLSANAHPPELVRQCATLGRRQTPAPGLARPRSWPNLPRSQAGLPWFRWHLPAAPGTTLARATGALQCLTVLAWWKRRPAGFVTLYRRPADGPFRDEETDRLTLYQPAFGAVLCHFIQHCRHSVEASIWERRIGNLPAKQRAIINLAVQGLTNKEISDQLGSSETAVKFHLHRVYEKFGLRNRADLAAHAAESLRLRV